jgi:ribosomal protein S18 acetylase RimI-like enzyme
MSIQYRLLRPAEEDLAVAFWMRTLETGEEEARQTFRDFHDAPQRFDQAHVAVAGDGQILATVCYWLRDVRDTVGAPVRVGHLFHVATEPSARRQGHASRLLADVIHALRATGCQWAILSARQDAVGLYARAGWQPAPRSYWRGAFAAESWHGRQRYAVRQYDPRHEPRGWVPIAAAYAQANAGQAGSLIRTSAYWSGYAAWMFGLYLDSYQAILLTASDGAARDPIRGYALTNFDDMGFLVSEIATDPSDPEVLPSLLNGIITEAQQRGIPLRGQLTIADGALTQMALAQLFGSTLHQVDDVALYGYLPFMVRPIGDATVSPFVAPLGLFWPLDAY